MRIIFCFALAFALLASGNTFGQALKIVPGTVSLREDGTLNTAPVPYPNILDKNSLVVSTYYGSAVGGARTSWDSSPYEEYALFYDENASSNDFQHVYENPSDPNDPLNGTLKWPFWNKWRLNFRMMYPNGFDNTDSLNWVNETDTTTKYPLIIMMHGLGEAGDGWSGPRSYSNNNDYKNYFNNDHNLLHGGREHRDAVNNWDPVIDGPIDPGKQYFPGFTIFPQNYSGWNTGATGFGGTTFMITELIEALPQYFPIDLNRIYIHGLSNGGIASYMLIRGRPDLFAAAAPMSGIQNINFLGEVIDDDSIVHIPLWQFQGETDPRPTVSATTTVINNQIAAGGLPRFTIYPNVGHNTWTRAYAEDDFFEWLRSQTKLRIHPYYGITEACAGQAVSVKLGVSPGFSGYIWQKIVNGDTTVIPNTPVTPHIIFADEIGHYRVRFARGEPGNLTWTDWSEPLEITTKSSTVDPVITPLSSTSLDDVNGGGLGSVTLQGPKDPSIRFYRWEVDGGLVQEGDTLTQLVTNVPGVYTLIITDEDFCSVLSTNSIVVNDGTAGSAGTPSAPTALQALTESENTINTFWTDNADNETGFEVYRSETSGGPYEYVALLPSNSIYHVDSTLEDNKTYYYVVRSVNNVGPSLPSSEAFASTNSDVEDPSAPMSLSFDGLTNTEYRIQFDPPEQYAMEHFEVNLDEANISWDASTDNIGISQYIIYNANGVAMDSTSNTWITLTGLNPNSSYSVYIVAEDQAGNRSLPSQQLNFSTKFSGLQFFAYSLIVNNEIKLYSNWPAAGSATTSNFYIDAKNQFIPEYDFFAMDFFGYIWIETADTYTFYTTSDDGSQLWIGDQMVVNNDGDHGMIEQSGSIALTPGAYPITVKYYERSGGEGLEVRWQSSTIPKQQIPSSVLTSTGDFDPLPSNAVEKGVINVGNAGNEWHTVNLTNSYTNPVVVIGAVSFNDAEAVTTRVRNKTSNSFEFQLQEWKYLDGIHGTEQVHYMVAEAGDYIFDDGKKLVAGSTSTNTNFTVQNFSPTSSTPVLFSQIVSYNESDPVITRVRNVNSSSFEIRIQEEEAQGTHGNELIDWIVIEQGGSSTDYEMSTDVADENWELVNFINTYSDPIVLAQQNTYAGSDPANTRIRNLGASSLEVLVQEEQSANSEVAHANETIGYAVFENGYGFNLAPPTAFNATAHSSLFQIDLGWTYDTEVDVVVLGSSTAAGFGASPQSTSWVNQFDAWLGTVTSTHTLTNLAVGGYTSYHIREDSYTPPGGRPSPDVTKNITAAMSLNPDIIIVNLPSNDVAGGYAASETMDNFRAVRDIAEQAGVEIFFTTTQPRDFFLESQRIELFDKAALIRAEFGNYVIDTYDSLANLSTYTIKPVFKFDNAHVNTLGHTYIFSEVVKTVGGTLPRFELYRSESASGPFEIITTTDPGVLAYTDPGLDQNTTYYYKARAVNSMSESLFSNMDQDVTPVDNQPPSTVTGLWSPSKNATSIALAWDAASDNVGVTNYIIYNNGEQIGSVNTRTLSNVRTLASTPATSTVIGGLNPEETYNLTVSAQDQNGNLGPASDVLSITTPSPLPVEFLSFTGRKIENGVELLWSTASETNNAFFTIERSEDLENFVSIGALDGAGNSSQVRNYRFLDTNPMPRALYRIKQTDFDGKFDYSKVILVDYSNLDDLTLYPNPTTWDQISLRGTVVGEELQVRLMDVSGRVYFEKVIDAAEVKYGASGIFNTVLRQGMYIVTISDGSNIVNKKLLIR